MMKRAVLLILAAVLLTSCGREELALEFRPVNRDVQIHEDVGPGRQVVVLEADHASSTATVGYYTGARCGTVRGPERVSATYEPRRFVIALHFPGGSGPTCADALVGAIEVELPKNVGDRTILARPV